MVRFIREPDELDTHISHRSSPPTPVGADPLCEVARAY
jgi:hypothetical protein